MSTQAMTHRGEVGSGAAPPPAFRVSSAANQLVEAAQSLLERCPLSSVDALSDYVRQDFPSVPEHELFSLVVGAVAGAQLASAHHFAVERGRVSYGRDMINVAINSGSFLAMWNLALPRLTRSPSGSSSLPEPRPRSEAPSLPSFIRHEFPGPRVRYDGDDDVPLATQRATQQDGGGLTPIPSSGTSVALPVVTTSELSTSAAVVEPYIPPLVSTAPITSIAYRPTPVTQPSACLLYTSDAADE